MYKDLPLHKRLEMALSLLTEAYTYFGTHAEPEDMATGAKALDEDLLTIHSLKFSDLRAYFATGRKKIGEIYRCTPAIIYKMIDNEHRLQVKTNNVAKLDELSDAIKAEKQQEFIKNVAIPYLQILQKDCNSKRIEELFPFIPASVIFDFLVKLGLLDNSFITPSDYQAAYDAIIFERDHADYFETKQLNNILKNITNHNNKDLNYRSKSFAIKKLCYQLEYIDLFNEIIRKLNG